MNKRVVCLIAVVVLLISGFGFALAVQKYFPTTWQYCVNEFGWNYSYDDEKGLVISSDDADSFEITISNDRPKQSEGIYAGELSDCVCVADGYVYYEANDGKIMQAPLSDSSKEKLVYTLEPWSYGNGEYVIAKLSKLGGRMLLSFHQGGAVMGANYIIELKDDGTAEEVQSSYFETTVIGDRLFSYYIGQMTGPGNLSMKEGDEQVISIGSKDYQYSSLTNGVVEGIQDFSLIGDELYVCVINEALGNKTVYKVNIKTNETVKVSKNQVVTSQIDGDNLYYLSNSKVYRVSLMDGSEELVATLPEGSGSNYDSCFAVLGGNIYWKNESDMELYTLDKKESLNPGAKLDSMGINGSDGEYLVCTFEETPSSKYRIMVFDKNGETVFKTSDKSYCKNITIEGNSIYFYNITSHTVCGYKIK